MSNIAFFRVDSAHCMGVGHVMRCIALADGLSKNDWDCHFICKQHKGSIHKIIEQHGHGVSLLDIDSSFIGLSEYEGWVGSTQIDDAKASLSSIKHAANLLIVDHYGLDEVWEKLVKPKVGLIIVIDDLANRAHACDILIDSKYGRLGDDYLDYIDGSTVLLVGAQYCILRNEFPELIDLAKEKRKKTKKIKTILINFGGTDPKGYSELAFDMITNNFSEIDIEIVIGSNHSCLEKFKRNKSRNIRVHIDTEVMASIILRCDFAIGSYGGSSWERCLLGLPSIGILSADNQKFIARSLHESGASKCINKEELFDELHAILNGDFSWWKIMSQNAFNICDGKGVSRILSCIEGCNNGYNSILR